MLHLSKNLDFLANLKTDANLEVVDFNNLDGQPSQVEIADAGSCFGTFGTLGTLGGCIGTFGTYGCG